MTTDSANCESQEPSGHHSWTSFFTQPARILRSYQRAYLRPDLVAGLTVAAVAIPQAIAYAAIVELPPETGLYTAAIAAIIGSLWGSSPFLHTGPTNATSMLMLSVLMGFIAFPDSDPDRYLLAAAVVAVMAGLFRIALAYLHFGALVTLASRSVLLGFTVGAGLLIAVGQVRHLLRLDLPPAPGLHTTLAGIFERIGDIHWPSVVVGLGTLALILVLSRIHRRIPATILAIAAAAVAVVVLGLEQQGVVVLGHIPGSLPMPTLLARESMPDFDMVRKLALGAMAVAALGLIEAMATAQNLARHSGQSIDNNQEFFGQGMANLFTGMFSGYAASGSFTRSALAYQAGAKSQMTGVFSGVAILAAMLLLAPYAGVIPKAALAGVLFVVAWRMIDRKAIVRVWKTSRAESSIMIATFVATLTLPLEFAVLAGVVLSLAFFVIRSSLPRVYQVVPDPTFRHFVESPSAPVCPQLGVVTIRGPLFFGAVHHIEEALKQNLEEYPGQNQVVIRMHGVDLCDLTGIEMLEGVIQHHRQMGGDVFLVRLRKPVLDAMEDAGFFETLGKENILAQEEAVDILFDRVIDPAVCIYECEHRVFAECQAIVKHAWERLPPEPVCREIDEERHLDTQRARELIEQENPLIIDVREETEFLRGHLPNARLLPLRELMDRVGEVPRDRTVLVVCRSGRRTHRAMRMLTDLEFGNIYGIRGGYLSWLAAGFPHTSSPVADESKDE